MDEIQLAEYLEKKKQDSGNITYIYSEKHIAARNRKKLRTLKRLARSIAKLRRKVADDLDSPEKGELAMVVALIDETYERVGNPDSAEENHFGVTTWRKKHVSFPGSKAVIRYKGKGGVDQEKTVASKRIVSLLKGVVAEKKADDELFPDITSGMVNAYLKPFRITAKDIRGFHANEEMKKALGKTKKKGGDEKQRKEEFKKALEETAKVVGHDPGTLKKDYLVPSFEENYLESGRIGAKSSSAADKENRHMSHGPRVAGHLNRMLALRKLAKKDKKQWEKDSAMLAIMAPSGVVRKLRKIVDQDTVSPDGLHMTLLFLGKVADLDDATMKAIQRAAEKVCSRHQPLAMRVSGAGMFAPGEDGTPVYVVPNAKGLSALQADLENAVGSIIDLPSEHGWVPHMTVAYSCDDRPSPPELKEYPEWTAKTVRLQAGGRSLADLPLGRKKTASEAPLSCRAASEENGNGNGGSEWRGGKGMLSSVERIEREVEKAYREEHDPLYNPPPPEVENEPDPWAVYEDPVKHQREDRPRITMPWNIPDMQVIWAEGLEGEQKIPLSEGLDESDPGGKYVVQDIADRELARYDTEEKAIENAKKTKWSWRVIFIGDYDDVFDAIVYARPDETAVPWTRSREYVGQLMDEMLGGPYYLKDYWGRTVASFSDRKKAIENAERNMYISHVVGSLTGDPDRGKMIWEKPKRGSGTQTADDAPKQKAYTGPLEDQTEENEYFRKVLFTGKHSQLVLMSLKGGEEIGEEVHDDVDQFFRIDEGAAIFVLDGTEKRVDTGGGALVPAGTRHNVINASKTEPLKLYSVYSPPQHPPKTIHKTKEDAEKAEKKEHGEQEAMDVLPIAADPVLWTDEQLAEVVKVPHLMEQLEQKPELLKAVLEQIAKRKGAREGLEPKDIGKWMERGWVFLIGAAGHVFGLFRNSHEASMARSRMISEIADGRFPEAAEGLKDEIKWQLRDAALTHYGRMGGDVTGSYEQDYEKFTDKVEQDLNRASDELLTHPFYKDVRKRLAEAALDTVKMPRDFQPDVIPHIAGGIPTDEEAKEAGRAWSAASRHLYGMKRPDPDQELAEEVASSADRIAKGIAGKQRMKEEGIDPEKMADDPPLSQRAMDRLPIASDPVLWTDEQLADVLKTPHLREQLEEKPELLKAVLEQITKRKGAQKSLKGLEPKDIGKWREHGWFLLHVLEYPLGWFSGREQAEMSRQRLVEMFAKGEPFDEGRPGVDAEGILDEAVKRARETTERDVDRWRMSGEKMRDLGASDAEKAADELKHHPFYEEKRRRFAEKAYGVMKAPEEFEPDKHAVVEGALPDGTTVWNTNGQIDLDPSEAGEKLRKDLKASGEQGKADKAEFVEDAVRSLEKRIRIREEGLDPDKLADDMPKAAGFIGRMIRLAEQLDDGGDREGAERLCRQLDFLISRKAHFVPSEKTKAPPMWRKNLDYGEDSPYFGSVKEFLKKYKGGLAEYIRKRRKSRKKRERQWRLAAIAGMPDMQQAVDDDLESGFLAPPNRFNRLLDLSKETDEELERQQDIRDDYIKDPLKAPREFVKYWSILLKKPRRRRRKGGR